MSHATAFLAQSTGLGRKLIVSSVCASFLDMRLAKEPKFRVRVLSGLARVPPDSLVTLPIYLCECTMRLVYAFTTLLMILLANEVDRMSKKQANSCVVARS